MATTGNSESRPRPTVFSISALGSGSKEPTTSSAAATGHINVSALGRKRRIGRAVESKLDPESDIAGIVLRIDLSKKGRQKGMNAATNVSLKAGMPQLCPDSGIKEKGCIVERPHPQVGRH